MGDGARARRPGDALQQKKYKKGPLNLCNSTKKQKGVDVYTISCYNVITTYKGEI